MDTKVILKKISKLLIKEGHNVTPIMYDPKYFDGKMTIGIIGEDQMKFSIQLNDLEKISNIKLVK